MMLGNILFFLLLGVVIYMMMKGGGGCCGGHDHGTHGGGHGSHGGDGDAGGTADTGHHHHRGTRETGGDGTGTDPVCGMQVDNESIVSRHRGRAYRFCSEQCRKTFELNPGKYVDA
ncbi:MAG: hypothetical protein Kow0089_07240 [Desulfobulbaceae bacterium]